MSKLLILRGVPASGKSTYAQQLTDYVRVNRDDIRFTMFGRYSDVDEGVVTGVENAMVSHALAAGEDVVLDATNLNRKFLRSKLSFASRYGATVEFEDFPISLAEALERNARRERVVPPAAIKAFYKRYKIDQDKGTLPAPPLVLPTFEPYVADLTKPSAFIVDTDGTMANHEGVRNPYDTSRYHLDTVREHVAIVVEALRDSGEKIIALSGRDEKFRDVTEQWWWANDLDFDEFFMRPTGDTRMDAIIKYELFKEHIEPNYNVIGAFDDRPQVVRMWQTIGVPVLNVGTGEEF